MSNTAFILVDRPAGFYPPFEEYSAREQAMVYFSDTYKDTYGFRPRGTAWNATAGQLIRAEKNLFRIQEANRERECEEEKARVREANAKAHAKRIHAATVNGGFTIGARWP